MDSRTASQDPCSNRPPSVASSIGRGHPLSVPGRHLMERTAVDKMPRHPMRQPVSYHQPLSSCLPQARFNKYSLTGNVPLTLAYPYCHPGILPSAAELAGSGIRYSCRPARGGCFQASDRPLPTVSCRHPNQRKTLKIQRHSIQLRLRRMNPVSSQRFKSRIG